MATITNYWRLCLDVSGRTPRREYFTQMIIWVLMPALVFGAILPFISENGENVEGMLDQFKIAIFVLALPLFTAAVRRLNDAGRHSMWWLIIASLIPYVGIAFNVYLFILTLKPSAANKVS
jgi:uncharacterized membrane protein YhaH (DUF805 family)